MADVDAAIVSRSMKEAITPWVLRVACKAHVKALKSRLAQQRELCKQSCRTPCGLRFVGETEASPLRLRRAGANGEKQTKFGRKPTPRKSRCFLIEKGTGLKGGCRRRSACTAPYRGGWGTIGDSSGVSPRLGPNPLPCAVHRPPGGPVSWLDARSEPRALPLWSAGPAPVHVEAFGRTDPVRGP